MNQAGINYNLMCSVFTVRFPTVRKSLCPICEFSVIVNHSVRGGRSNNKWDCQEY